MEYRDRNEGKIPEKQIKKNMIQLVIEIKILKGLLMFNRFLLTKLQNIRVDAEIPFRLFRIFPTLFPERDRVDFRGYKPKGEEFDFQPIIDIQTYKRRRALRNRYTMEIEVESQKEDQIEGGEEEAKGDDAWQESKQQREVEHVDLSWCVHRRQWSKYLKIKDKRSQNGGSKKEERKAFSNKKSLRRTDVNFENDFALKSKTDEQLEAIRRRRKAKRQKRKLKKIRQANAKKIAEIESKRQNETKLEVISEWNEIFEDSPASEEICDLMQESDEALNNEFNDHHVSDFGSNIVPDKEETVEDKSKFEEPKEKLSNSEEVLENTGNDNGSMMSEIENAQNSNFQSEEDLNQEVSSEDNQNFQEELHKIEASDDVLNPEEESVNPKAFNEVLQLAWNLDETWEEIQSWVGLSEGDLNPEETKIYTQKKSLPKEKEVNVGLSIFEDTFDWIHYEESETVSSSENTSEELKMTLNSQTFIPSWRIFRMRIKFELPFGRQEEFIKKKVKFLAKIWKEGGVNLKGFPLQTWGEKWATDLMVNGMVVHDVDELVSQGRWTMEQARKTELVKKLRKEYLKSAVRALVYANKSNS
jgi:hypothetical protein